MIPISVLRAMAAAGASQETILAAIEADNLIELERIAAKKEKNRIRVRNQRSRARTLQHSGAQQGTFEHPSSPPLSSSSLPPPVPPSITTPPDSPLSPGARKPPARSAIKVPLPDGYALSDRMINYALDRGWTHARIQDEFEKFCLHAQKTGVRYANWDAAWMSWVRSPYQQAARARPAAGKKSVNEICDDMLREIDERERMERGRSAAFGNGAGQAVVQLLPPVRRA